MSDKSELEPTAMTVTLDPSSVSIDERGRVRLEDARVVAAMVTAVPAAPSTSERAAKPPAQVQPEAPNYFQCGANNYQCYCGTK